MKWVIVSNFSFALYWTLSFSNVFTDTDKMHIFCDLSIVWINCIVNEQSELTTYEQL